MTVRSVRRRRIASVGVAVLGVFGVLTAGCESSSTQEPSTTTTTTTTTTAPPLPSSAPAAPTEKSINPTGGNLFTPPVVAPAAPTVPPGQHPGINGVP